MRELIQKLDRQLFFPFLKEAESEKYRVERITMRYDYQPDTLRHAPAVLRDYFEHCTKNWDLDRFHYHYTRPCTIEPTLGYAVTRQQQLIPQSLWNTYVHRLKPSFLKYFLGRRPVLRLKTAIPLHYGWGNYWHCYNDILGAVRRADKAGLPPDTPLLIPEGLPKLRFFQQLLALSPALQARNWVPQPANTNVVCEEAHFFATFWDHRENFDAVLEYIGFKQNLRQEPAGQRRIFIGRNPRRGRNILNIEEVRTVLAKYDFDYVECDDLSVREQIDIFQHAGCVIGIHGAGLTNIIFRQDRPLKLLEIFSAQYLNPCYYWLCVQYGFDYFGLVGSKPAEVGSIGNFTVDIEEFENQINAMLR
jgi:hypothetical protein